MTYAAMRITETLGQRERDGHTVEGKKGGQHGLNIKINMNWYITGSS